MPISQESLLTLYLLDVLLAPSMLNSTYKSPSVILCKSLPLLLTNGWYLTLKLSLPSVGASVRSDPNKSLETSLCFFSSTRNLDIFIKSGASLSIASTLYLTGSTTKSLLSTPFFNAKKVSSSILFLSDDGNDNQTSPSSSV